MQAIGAILFEPVGCLAEFPSEPFHEIACRSFGVPKKKPSRSASRAYWRLLNLMEAEVGTSIEALEREAADAASIYEDVLPALSELKALHVRLCVASSLAQAAVTHFIEKHSLGELFDAVWSRDNAGGIKSVPLQRAAEGTADGTIFLTDTLEGLKAGKRACVRVVLMMNDPDEARRLAMHDPAGGIVSLQELPDFVRLLLSRGAKGLFPNKL